MKRFIRNSASPFTLSQFASTSVPSMDVKDDQQLSLQTSTGQRPDVNYDDGATFDWITLDKYIHRIAP